MAGFEKCFFLDAAATRVAEEKRDPVPIYDKKEARMKKDISSLRFMKPFSRRDLEIC